MEIKQGDMVRVSKDAPRMYVTGFNHIYKAYESTVLEVDDGNAVIKPSVHVRPTAKLIIPTKYLIKVDAEAKEPKFKKGDRVRHIKNDECGVVLDVQPNGVYVGIPYSLQKRFWKNREIELVQPKEQTEAEKTNTDSIVSEIDKVIEGYCKTLADIADSFDWQRYEADLAKEIAVKVANKYSDPTEAAEYAVRVAKAVVKNLKNKQI